MTLKKQDRVFPIVTNALQKAFENETKELSDTTPEICGYYGRACRQMGKEEGANRAICMVGSVCPLAKYIKEKECK